MARKINSALWKHIVYEEYVPLLSTLPPYTGYQSNINPSVTNSFATAAFRYGHSLVPNEFPQLDNGFNSAHEAVTLQEAFFNRVIINGRGIEPTMFGLLANTSNNVDDGFAHAVARKLFVAVGSDEYLDLTALNIQRGRDHGLPGHNAYREKCGLFMATWTNLQSIMVTGTAKKFQAIYQSPDDIDIFAGGISEKHMENLVVGPTFNCILSEQFKDARDGDRFYYKNSGVFTISQLDAIKKVTMSTILCNNLKGIVSIKPHAFRTPEHQCNNSRRVCSSMPTLDLTQWQERKNTKNEVDLSKKDTAAKEEYKIVEDVAKEADLELIASKATKNNKDTSDNEITVIEEYNKLDKVDMVPNNLQLSRRSNHRHSEEVNKLHDRRKRRHELLKRLKNFLLSEDEDADNKDEEGLKVEKRNNENDKRRMIKNM